MLFYNLSKNTNLDIVNLSLRIMRYIALYNTQTKNIKAKVLLSFADNYYNGLRYFIYKKNKIENILLAQNAMRMGFISSHGGDLYTYCDYYFGFGKRMVDTQKGMVCNNKLYIGSIRLISQLKKEIKDKDKKYDITFVEELALEDSFFNLAVYMKALNNFIKFSKKYKEYKIAYTTRKDKRLNATGELKAHAKRIKDMIVSSNITFENNKQLSAYDVVKNSEVIIFVSSTMGYEALGLDKKVLQCYYDKENIFAMSHNEEIGVLIDNSYDKFEEKLLNILNGDHTQYFKNKKIDFMNITDDPRKIIANHIENLL